MLFTYPLILVLSNIIPFVVVYKYFFSVCIVFERSLYKKYFFKKALSLSAFLATLLKAFLIMLIIYHITANSNFHILKYHITKIL